MLGDGNKMSLLAGSQDNQVGRLEGPFLIEGWVSRDACRQGLTWSEKSQQKKAAQGTEAHGAQWDYRAALWNMSQDPLSPVIQLGQGGTRQGWAGRGVRSWAELQCAFVMPLAKSL